MRFAFSSSLGLMGLILWSCQPSTDGQQSGSFTATDSVLQADSSLLTLIDTPTSEEVTTTTAAPSESNTQMMPPNARWWWVHDTLQVHRKPKAASAILGTLYMHDSVQVVSGGNTEQVSADTFWVWNGRGPDQFMGERHLLWKAIIWQDTIAYVNSLGIRRNPIPIIDSLDHPVYGWSPYIRRSSKKNTYENPFPTTYLGVFSGLPSGKAGYISTVSTLPPFTITLDTVTYQAYEGAAPATRGYPTDLSLIQANFSFHPGSGEDFPAGSLIDIISGQGMSFPSYIDSEPMLSPDLDHLTVYLNIRESRTTSAIVWYHLEWPGNYRYKVQGKSELHFYNQGMIGLRWDSPTSVLAWLRPMEGYPSQEAYVEQWQAGDYVLRVKLVPLQESALGGDG